MSTLKDIFSNYAPQPDPKVWKSIERKVLHPHRKYYVAASALTAIAATALVLSLTLGNRQENNATPTAAVPTVINEQPTAVITTSDITSETVVAPSLASQDPSGNASQTEIVSVLSQTSQPNTHDRNEVTCAQTALDETSTANLSYMAQTSNVGVTSATANSGVVPTPETNLSVSTPVRAIVQNESNTVQQSQAENDIRQERSKMTQNERKAANDSLVVWIPNAFAPDDIDADPSVRSFKVRPNSNASIVSFEMYIYSRTGRMVFHTKDIEKAWDGTANGQAQPMGTYVYVIQLNDAVKGLQHTRGTITLVR